MPLPGPGGFSLLSATSPPLPLDWLLNHPSGLGFSLTWPSHLKDSHLFVLKCIIHWFHA